MKKRVNIDTFENDHYLDPRERRLANMPKTHDTLDSLGRVHRFKSKHKKRGRPVGRRTRKR